MKPRPRVRWVLKWVGLVACLALTVCLVLSFTADWRINRTKFPEVNPRRIVIFTIALRSGKAVACDVNYCEPAEPPHPVLSTGRAPAEVPHAEWEKYFDEDNTFLAARMAEIRFEERWWAAEKGNSPRAEYRDRRNWYVVLPAWCTRGLLGLLLAGTTLLTYRNWKPPDPRRCPRCRYDRSGLAPGGLCPECGAGAPGGAA